MVTTPPFRAPLHRRGIKTTPKDASSPPLEGCAEGAGWLLLVALFTPPFRAPLHRRGIKTTPKDASSPPLEGCAEGAGWLLLVALFTGWWLFITDVIAAAGFVAWRHWMMARLKNKL